MEDTSVFATVLLPVALALIMGALGLSLTPADFKRIVTSPRGVLIGLMNLLLISPALAFLVAELYDLEAAFAVGLVLLGASPGGTMANLLTHLALGDTALSISMTALSSLAAVVTVPLFLKLAVDHFDASVADDVSMLGVVVRVFFITVVPLSVGMWIRARDPVAAARREQRAKRVAFVVWILVVVGAVIAEFETIQEHFTELAIATLTLNVLAMGVSYTLSRLARLSAAQATAVAMELGIHNATIAIAVGTSIADVLAIPAAVYSAFMFITAGSFAKLMHARNGAAAEAEAARRGDPAAEPAAA